LIITPSKADIAACCAQKTALETQTSSLETSWPVFLTALARKCARKSILLEVIQ